MASGYSPAAIQACFDAIHDVIPAAINAGIYGNKPGYHNCRAQCSPNDYSVQKPDDRVGDVWAGSAVDVTMYATSDMKRATQNLINATKAGDPRLLGLREFFGTLDGVNVTGMDVRGKYYVTSDDSHLWHVHLSFYRKYANSTAACLDIAEVFTGQAAAPADIMEEIMSYYASKADYEDKMFALMTSAVQQFLKYGPDGKTYGFDTLLAKRIGPVSQKVDTVIAQTS